VAANGYVWLVTNYPLQQLYGFAARDRVGNLALCQVVAAGNSPLRTAQLGQLHFEPFWGLLVALLSGFEPDRVLRLYPYFAFLAAAGFTVSLYLGLRPSTRRGEAWSGWERALMAAFATLLSSSPLEFTGIYRLPWSLTFLLKPNHALGLVLFPIVLYVFVRARGFAGRLLAGFLLHLLAWAFVLHMAYVAAGLVLHAALSFATRHPERGRDVRDVAVTIGVNVLIVSPYLVMLLVGYPFLVPSALQTIAVTSPHLLEVTARAAPIAASRDLGGDLRLAAPGSAGAGVGGAGRRRVPHLGGLPAAQRAAASARAGRHVLLGTLPHGRLRGLGAWDLARRVARALPRPLAPAHHGRAHSDFSRCPCPCRTGTTRRSWTPTSPARVPPSSRGSWIHRLSAARHAAGCRDPHRRRLCALSPRRLGARRVLLADNSTARGRPRSASRSRTRC
jgi:hypothetical protein